jgi:NADH-quinone oxidoreductase subunit D
VSVTPPSATPPLGEEQIIGIGAAPADITLDLGELHPSGHGAMRVRCSFTDVDEVVRVGAAEPMPGLLHRGTEKLLEVRDYRAGLMLANRHDWLSAVTSEVTMALAIEELLGLTPPPRATWLRTLLCEMNRAMAGLMHLAGAATLPGRGVSARDVPGMAARETWQYALERISGGRIHAMITRIGGVANDAPEGWFDDVRAAVAATSEQLPTLRELAVSVVSGDGVAVLSHDDALAYSVSGPVARASALDLDLRRDSPSLAYAELADVVQVIVRDEGDAAARYAVLADQIAADLDVIEACIDRMPDGEVNVQLPKVVRAPEGTAYAWLEAATGINGVLVVSTGETTPWRVRLRTASYANVQAMSAALPGTALADLPAAIGSFLFVVGDLDH